MRHLWKTYRNKSGWPKWYQRYLEAWWVITGRWSLHRAWQAGRDDGAIGEYRRLITNKAYIAEARLGSIGVQQAGSSLPIQKERT